VKNKLIVWFGTIAACFAIASPVLAHHSMSMYDLNRLITVKGIVVDFSWSNPHAQIQIDVEGDRGNVRRWTADGPSPRRLSKIGWSKDILKAGDHVTIVGNQAKDGSSVMRLGRVILPNGEELNGYSRSYGEYTPSRWSLSQNVEWAKVLWRLWGFGNL
jgi:Family of unknown function (DUF6152)